MYVPDVRGTAVAEKSARVGSSQIFHFSQSAGKASKSHQRNVWERWRGCRNISYQFHAFFFRHLQILRCFESIPRVYFWQFLTTRYPPPFPSTPPPPILPPFFHFPRFPGPLRRAGAFGCG